MNPRVFPGPKIQVSMDKGLGVKMNNEYPSDFSYDEWLVKLADKNMGIGEPVSITGIIQVGEFFEKTRLVDELDAHLQKWSDFVENSSDDRAKQAFVRWRNRVDNYWRHPKVKLYPVTMGYAFHRLHHAEQHCPREIILTRTVDEFGWFIEAFGDQTANSELSRIKAVADTWTNSLAQCGSILD